MFDAQKLLNQVMGALPQDGGRAPGAGAPGAGMGGGAGQLLTGGLAGGVLGLLAGNKRARKMAMKSAGTAATLGGLAAVAAIGYTAWQRHRGAAVPAGGGALQLPPADSGFALERAPRGQDRLAQSILVAMIQGAKADGHIDAGEQARISQHVGALDAEAKAFVMDELAAPLDPARVAAHADTPEVAVELYAAAFLAMDPDTASERLFLNRLQAALGLEPDLARHVEEEALRAEAAG